MIPVPGLLPAGSPTPRFRAAITDAVPHGFFRTRPLRVHQCCTEPSNELGHIICHPGVRDGSRRRISHGTEPARDFSTGAWRLSYAVSEQCELSKKPVPLLVIQRCWIRASAICRTRYRADSGHRLGTSRPTIALTAWMASWSTCLFLLFESRHKPRARQVLLSPTSSGSSATTSAAPTHMGTPMPNARTSPKANKSSGSSLVPEQFSDLRREH